MHLITAPFGNMPDGTNINLLMSTSWVIGTALLIFLAFQFDHFSKSRTALRARYAEICNRERYSFLDFKNARDEILGTRRWVATATAVLVAVALSASAMVFVVVPAAQSADKASQVLENRWHSTVADWSLAKYGVTDGMYELEYSVALFQERRYRAVKVIAQGKIVNANLLFIGKTPVLVTEEDHQVELPLVGR
jgi:hypothetical protein